MASAGCTRFHHGGHLRCNSLALVNLTKCTSGIITVEGLRHEREDAYGIFDEYNTAPGLLPREPLGISVC